MTGAVRQHIRQQRHLHALEYAQAWIRAHGAPDCEHCGNPVAEQMPGKKFCSPVCQKAFNRRFDPSDRPSRKASQRRNREQRRAA